MPCGLCGVREAIMCNSPIAAEQVSGCPISAIKPKGCALKPAHQCKLISGMDYSLLSRVTCAVNSPSDLPHLWALRLVV